MLVFKLCMVTHGWPDGRVRIDFVNPRLDEIQVLLVAKRRSGAK